MIFLPGSCERCFDLSLISSEDCIGARSLCAACGGLVNIIPGCAYPEGDVPLFDELCSRVKSSAIGGLEAEQLALALDECLLCSGEQEAVGALTFWLPELKPLRPLLAANLPRARQAFAMLQTILNARARTRRSDTSGARRARGNGLADTAREDWKATVAARQPTLSNGERR